MLDKIRLIKFARKALVAALVPVLVALAGKLGVSLDSAELTVALTGLVTSVVVYLVPNAKKELEQADVDVEG